MWNYNFGELITFENELQAKVFALKAKIDANNRSGVEQDTFALNELLQTSILARALIARLWKQPDEALDNREVGKSVFLDEVQVR